MANISLRDLPSDTLAEMKSRAAKSRRSLNQELISTVEGIVTPAVKDKTVILNELRNFHQKTQRMDLSERAINEAKRSGRP